MISDVVQSDIINHRPLILPVDVCHIAHLVEGEVFVLGMLVRGQITPFAVVSIRKAVKAVVAEGVGAVVVETFSKELSSKK